MAERSDLHNRGIQDILIACVDGLKGFPEAIASIFPQTEVQLCVVHQIRNSLRYIASKDQKAFMADLKPVYRADTKAAAELALDELETKWGEKYPIVLESWRSKWELLSAYFRYPKAIRKPIYTTNAVEAVHRQFRTLTKTKGAFPNENSLLKLLYIGINQAIKFSKIFHNCLIMLYSLIKLLEYFNEICTFNYLNSKTFTLFLIPNSGYLIFYLLVLIKTMLIFLVRLALLHSIDSQ